MPPTCLIMMTSNGFIIAIEQMHFTREECTLCVACRLHCTLIRSEHVVQMFSIAFDLFTHLNVPIFTVNLLKFCE